MEKTIVMVVLHERNSTCEVVMTLILRQGMVEEKS